MQTNDHPTLQAYLYMILKSFQQYEYTRSPQVLKNFTKKNREILQNIIDQIQANKVVNNVQKPTRKSSCDGFSTLKNTEEEKERDENMKLERQYMYELELAKGNNEKVLEERKKIRERQMDNTLRSLDERITKLKIQNEGMSKKLEKQRFYREWVLMSKEAEGAKNLNGKLKIQLEKKREQIQQLKKKL